MADKKMPTNKVVTGKVRFCYVNVFEPRAAMEGQEEKFSVCIIIPKSDTATVKRIKDTVKGMIEANKDKWGGKIPAGLKVPLRDGDEERGDRPEFAGAYFMNLSSKFKPGLVDARMNPIIDPDEFYSGCYGRASMLFYAYNTAGNKGIGAGLSNVQKLSDGEPLGSRTRAEDDFEAVDEEDVFA